MRPEGRQTRMGKGIRVPGPHEVLGVQEGPTELHLRHIVDLLRQDPRLHLRPQPPTGGRG